MDPVQRNFFVNDLSIAAQQWGDSGSPFLALHGWMDNSASFSHLAPRLRNCQVIALDLAGQGHSAHRCAHGHYNLWDDLIDILAVADVLGWKKFNLLGHSRGAMAALLLAAAMPQRIEKLVMIDGALSFPSEAAESASQLRQHLEDYSLHDHGEPKRRDFEQALIHRTENLSLSEEDCRPLLLRGMERRKDGDFWRHDQRLKHASAFKLSREAQRSFLSALEAPSLLLLAERGFARDESLRQVLSSYSKIEVQEHAGGHHMHMESEHAANLAAIISRWLSR